MRKLVAVAAAAWVPFVSFAECPSAWRQVYAVTTDDDLHSVATADDWTAVAVGNRGTILRSQDGGETWSSVRPMEPFRTLDAVTFVDSLHGWAVGQSPCSDCDDAILRTDDGGLTWVPQRVSGFDRFGIFGHLYTAYFVDVNTGWAAGLYGWAGFHSALILHTTDGGATWREQPVLHQNHTLVNSIAFSDAQTGTAVGWGADPQLYSYMLTTSDGGHTWQPRRDASWGRWLNTVAYADTDWFRGVVGGDFFGLLSTNDGGASWQQTGDPYQVFSVAIQGPTGVAAATAADGTAGTLWSDDAGRSWEFCPGSNPTPALFSPGRAVAVNRRAIFVAQRP